MKLCFKIVTAFLISSTKAFSPFLTITRHSLTLRCYHALIHKSKTTSLNSSDDDDWYADYDPSKFKQSFTDDEFFSGSRRARNWGNEAATGGGGRGRSGTRRRSGYTRDTSRDFSNVDENAVVDLLNQRIEAKKVGDCGTADAIRDTLLNEYAVGVNDRE